MQGKFLFEKSAITHLPSPCRSETRHNKIIGIIYSQGAAAINNGAIVTDESESLTSVVTIQQKA